MRETPDEWDDYNESEDAPGPASATPVTLTVPAEALGQRLDQVLAQALPDYSRNRLQTWIEDGRVSVDGLARAGKYRLFGGETLQVTPATEIGALADAGEDIPLDVLHADADIAIINKPAGLVVHPGSGVASGTLLNALLHHFPETVAVPRAGIVHRLDRDTSGLLVVGRTLRAQTRLEIQKLHRELGVTSLFVTHDQVEAMTLAQRMIVMNQGVVEQIGTPEVVYLQPRTTFVAGFIGSPPMNLLPVKVVNGTVRLDGLELPLIHPAPRDGELVLGVRPEHAFFAGEGWPMQVEVVEMLGAERLVHTRVGQQTFIVRMDAGVTPAMPGQILNVQTVPGHVHWFDPQTRQRIDS
jgi:hypothetical protein